MAYLLVNKIKGTGLNTFTTAGIDTTGANFLVATWSDDGADVGVISDSNGNTWVAARNFAPFGLASRIYYAYQSVVVGAGHTFTLTGTGMVASLQVRAFSGALTASDPLDKVSEELSFGSGTVQPVATADLPFLPTEDGELIITHFELDTTPSAPSIDEGFIDVYGDVGSGGTYLGSYSAYLIQGAAAAVDPTWTRVSGTNNNYATIASFKAGVAAPDATAVSQRPKNQPTLRPAIFKPGNAR